MSPPDAALADATGADAGGILTGCLTLRAVRAEPHLRYYLYVPTTRARDRLLVAVHGISRKSREHGSALASQAERHGVVLIAPEFSAEYYPDYQRLGLESGRHPDVALEQVVADVEQLLGTVFSQFALFGYSGGGQFAHRYALIHPERVSALAVAAAGWYTWLTDGRRFPFGLAPTPARPEINCAVERFLAIPLCVLVGAKDTRRDGTLRRTGELDAQQGKTRLQRARTWFNALAREAARRRLDNTHELRVLATSGHNFLENVRRDRLDQHVFEFLFAARARAPTDDRSSSMEE